jgi:hypothetical protein
MVELKYKIKGLSVMIITQEADSEWIQRKRKVNTEPPGVTTDSTGREISCGPV